jgi:hypothetical protein
MIFSQGDDQSAPDNKNNELAKLLGLDDQSSGLLDPNNKEFASHLKVRIAGVAAVEPPIDADPSKTVHEINRRPNHRRAEGRLLVRTIAFGVLASVVVGAAFAWLFYGDVHGTQMVDAGKVPGMFVSSKTATKISDRVPTQDQAALPTQDQAALPTQDQAALPTQDQAALPTQDQAAPVLPPGQASVAPESSPEVQHQLESIASDVAMVRRIVERLAAVQEQMVADMAMQQKSGQNASQNESLLPPSPAVPVPSRKYAPVVARSNSRSVPVPPAPARSPWPWALH